jgi:2-dehydropantoate 2-reductase
MRIAVIGAGGIGAPLGASFAQAGHDVTFLARGGHLAAMRSDGLRIGGDRGETLIDPVQATDDPAAIGPVDLVLFCVKLWDVETAGTAIRPLMRAGTAVIPLQNGVDASERLAPILGHEHVMGGVALVTGSIVAPGVVRQSGRHHRMTFGELDGHVSARAEAIRGAGTAAGIEAILAPDIQRARWEKFVLLAAASTICAAARSAIGPLRADAEIWPLFGQGMAEVAAVGRAVGVDLPQEAVVSGMKFLSGVPDDWMPSMAVDLKAGRRLELPWLAGTLVRLATERGVPVPVLGTLHAVLKPYAMGGGRARRALPDRGLTEADATGSMAANGGTP